MRVNKVHFEMGKTKLLLAILSFNLISATAFSQNSETVELSYKVFRVGADGRAAAEIPMIAGANGQTARVAVGDQFIVRTQVRDRRQVPRGVYSAYHDMTFTNLNQSNRRTVDYLWGEYTRITVSSKALKGGFKLKLANDTSQLIALDLSAGFFDFESTAQRLVTELGKLRIDGIAIGAENITVRDPRMGENFLFDIYFRGHDSLVGIFRTSRS